MRPQALGELRSCLTQAPFTRKMLVVETWWHCESRTVLTVGGSWVRSLHVAGVDGGEQEALSPSIPCGNRDGEEGFLLEGVRAV